MKILFNGDKKTVLRIQVAYSSYENSNVPESFMAFFYNDTKGQISFIENGTRSLNFAKGFLAGSKYTRVS